MSDPASTPSLTAAEAIAPVLDEARALGLDFGAIVGLTVKRCSRLGIDLDELGKASESGLGDEAFHEQIVSSAWLLCAPEEEIAAAVAAGTASVAAEAWEASHVTSLEHQRALYRAFMARWLEYHAEMDRLFGGEA